MYKDGKNGKIKALVIGLALAIGAASFTACGEGGNTSSGDVSTVAGSNQDSSSQSGSTSSGDDSSSAGDSVEEGSSSGGSEEDSSSANDGTEDGSGGSEEDGKKEKGPDVLVFSKASGAYAEEFDLEILSSKKKYSADIIELAKQITEE